MRTATTKEPEAEKCAKNIYDGSDAGTDRAAGRTTSYRRLSEQPAWVCSAQRIVADNSEAFCRFVAKKRYP